MEQNIKICISSRLDMFENYYIVPNELSGEFNTFKTDLEALGENSTDAQDFEAKFAANGFQERFNTLLMRCTPKPYNITAEEKAASKEVAKEIFKEDRSRIIKEAVEDAADYASVMANEELIAMERKMRIEAGIDDEYTRASNAIDTAQKLGGFLKNKFKRKNK